jgi:hypothetical protein
LFLVNVLRNCALVLFAAAFSFSFSFAEDLPDAPSPQVAQLDPVSKAMTQRVCDTIHGVSCGVVPKLMIEGSAGGAIPNTFFLNVIVGWEHQFGTPGWEQKIAYAGAYRVTDKNTGRQYDVLRFDNEQGIPISEPADVGTGTIADGDYLNDMKAYQTQQKGKDGKYAAGDDDLNKKSMFVGEAIDEMDYDRRLHYFVAIPVGLDRSFQKQLGEVTLVNENEVSVGGLAYAGILQGDGSSDGHYGVNLFRTVDSVAFNFDTGKNTFDVTPIQLANDCAAFKQGVNCETVETATFQYQNDKTSIGFDAEIEHRSNLTLFDQTQSENTLKLGVSFDPVKAAQGITRVIKKL